MDNLILFLVVCWLCALLLLVIYQRKWSSDARELATFRYIMAEWDERNRLRTLEFQWEEENGIKAEIPIDADDLLTFE